MSVVSLKQISLFSQNVKLFLCFWAFKTKNTEVTDPSLLANCSITGPVRGLCLSVVRPSRKKACGACRRTKHALHSDPVRLIVSTNREKKHLFRRFSDEQSRQRGQLSECTRI